MSAMNWVNPFMSFMVKENFLPARLSTSLRDFWTATPPISSKAGQNFKYFEWMRHPGS
jgi:hypothetical protein